MSGPIRVGKKHSQWSHGDMQHALRACREDGVTPSEAARSFGVPRKTLTHTLQGKVSEDCKTAGRKRASTPGQEKDSAYMAGRGFPLTISQILMLAWCIDKVNGRKVFGATGPCEGWWRSFRLKYLDATKVRRPDRMDRGRAIYSNVNIIRDYFQLLREHLEKGGYSERP